MADVTAEDPTKGVAFTVADLLEAGRRELGLTLVAGRANLAHAVDEPIVNRPGLALTGFYDHFAGERLQILGHAEIAYMRALDDATRLERLQALFDHGAYAFVCTNGLDPLPDEIGLFERSSAVLMRTPQLTRDFAQAAGFLLERLGAPRTQIYGTMVEVNGVGVLIEGAPGLGKSETALGLVKRGHALVADDLTRVRRGVGRDQLFGSAGATAGYMEIRGIGIVHVPSIFGVTSVRGEKRLQLVITFRRLEEVAGEIDRTGQTRHVRTILGVDVPNVIIPVSEGRDLVNLVETAVQQHRYVMAGHDPVAELSGQLRQRAGEHSNGQVVLGQGG